MHRFIDRLTFWCCILLPVLTLSCTDDSDERLSDSGRYQVTYGIVEKPTMQSYTIKLDEGITIYPQESTVPSFNFENRMRVEIDYTILEPAQSDEEFNYYVRLNGAREVLTKKIISDTEAPSAPGNDPIELTKIWIVDEYLNFEYLYIGGSKTSEHQMNLVMRESATTDNRILLDFHHDADQDSATQAVNGSVSFRLDEAFPQNTDPIRLRIRYKTYDKEKTFDLIYQPYTRITDLHNQPSFAP